MWFTSRGSQTAQATTSALACDPLSPSTTLDMGHPAVGQRECKRSVAPHQNSTAPALSTHYRLQVGTPTLVVLAKHLGNGNFAVAENCPPFRPRRLWGFYGDPCECGGGSPIALMFRGSKSYPPPSPCENNTLHRRGRGRGLENGSCEFQTAQADHGRRGTTAASHSKKTSKLTNLADDLTCRGNHFTKDHLPQTSWAMGR